MRKLFIKSYDSYCRRVAQNMHLEGKRMKVRKYAQIFSEKTPSEPVILSVITGQFCSSEIKIRPDEVTNKFGSSYFCLP